MPWIHLTCGKCGHETDLDAFTRTPIGGDLPKNVYQCPACRVAFERKVGPGTLYESGSYAPGAVEVVAVPTRL